MAIKKTPGNTFYRARDTSKAMQEFTEGLGKSRDSVVGNENLHEASALQLRNPLVIEKDTDLDKLDARLRSGDKFITQEYVDAVKLGAGEQVSDKEALWMLQTALDEGNFEKGADGQLTLDARKMRFDMLRFAVLHLQDIDPQALNSPQLEGLQGLQKELAAERLASDPNQQAVINEYFAGIKRQLPILSRSIGEILRGKIRGENGEAKPEYVKQGKIISQNVTSVAAVHELAVDATPREVFLDFMKGTDEIGAWSKEFGRAKKSGKEPWVMGCKPGINWGINGYPTVTSAEAVYADTLGSLIKAREHGVKGEVWTIDESGIECKTFERNTRMNMADTGILGGSVLAGVEFLVQTGPHSDPKLADLPGPLAGEAAHEAAVAYVADKLRAQGVELPEGAGALEVMEAVAWEHQDLVDVAELGGAKCVPLDESDTYLMKPVVAGEDDPIKPDEVRVTQEQFDSMKHFQGGIRVSKVLQEVDSLHNNSKPPGRHGIMSNCGSTGACKNFIGVMSGVERTEGLHSEWARTPPRREGEEFGSYADRLKEYVKWLGPAGVKHADLVAQKAGEDQGGFGDWEKSEGDLLKMSEEWVEHLSSQSQKDVEEFGEEAYGPGQAFFEKLAELALLFNDKTTFTYTDMRKTMGSFGPDFGDVAEVGRSLFSDKAATVDMLAAVELKRAYENAQFKDFTPDQVGEGLLGDPNPEDDGLLARIRSLPARIEARVRNTAGHIFTRSQGKAWLKGGDTHAMKAHAALMHTPGMATADVNNITLRGEVPETILKSEELGDRSPLSGLINAKKR